MVRFCCWKYHTPYRTKKNKAFIEPGGATQATGGETSSMVLQWWSLRVAIQAKCAHWHNSTMTVVWVTSCFTIGFEACSTGGNLDCRPNQKVLWWRVHKPYEGPFGVECCSGKEKSIYFHSSTHSYPVWSASFIKDDGFFSPSKLLVSFKKRSGLMYRSSIIARCACLYGSTVLFLLQ